MNQRLWSLCSSQKWIIFLATVSKSDWSWWDQRVEQLQVMTDPSGGFDFYVFVFFLSLNSLRNLHECCCCCIILMGAVSQFWYHLKAAIFRFLAFYSLSGLRFWFCHNLLYTHSMVIMNHKRKTGFQLHCVGSFVTKVKKTRVELDNKNISCSRAFKH